jgi:hypothetical protein
MEKEELRAKKRKVDYTFSFFFSWLSGEKEEYRIEPFGIVPSMLMMSFTTIFFSLCTSTCVLEGVWAITYTISFLLLARILVGEKEKKKKLEIPKSN